MLQNIPNQHTLFFDRVCFRFQVKATQALIKHMISHSVNLKHLKISGTDLELTQVRPPAVVHQQVAVTFVK